MESYIYFKKFLLSIPNIHEHESYIQVLQCMVYAKDYYPIKETEWHEFNQNSRILDFDTRTLDNKEYLYIEYEYDYTWRVCMINVQDTKDRDTHYENLKNVQNELFRTFHKRKHQQVQEDLLQNYWSPENIHFWKQELNAQWIITS